MSAKLTILGCGGSAGVPVIGNDWGKCDPLNPKNRRTRCSALIESDTTRLIVDTGPDFRAQMNAFALKNLDAVLYTHFHGDHISGFEELRNLFNTDRSRGVVPLYADSHTQNILKTRFPHMFEENDTTGFYPLPVAFKGWSDDDMGTAQRVGDIDFTLVPLEHGPFHVTGYRFGDVAYCTDCSAIKESSLALLKGVKTLIIDCNNMFNTQSSAYLHMHVGLVYELNEKLKCPDVILTHLRNVTDYDAASAQLPDGYRLAYDGLVLDLGSDLTL